MASTSSNNFSPPASDVSANPARLEVACLPHPDRLAAAEWDALALRLRRPTIYHTHDWAQCWLEHLGSRVEPRIISLRENGELVALLPLAAATQRLGCFRRRVLTNLGAQSPAASQYLGPVCPAEREDALLPILARAAAEAAADCDAIHMESFLQGDPTDRFMQKLAASEGQRAISWSGAWTHTVPLRPTSQEFLDALPRKLRKNLLRTRKRFQHTPGAAIERITNVERLEQIIPAFCQQSIARLRELRLRSTLEDEAMARFFSAFTRRAFERGRAACFAASLDGRIAGTLFAYHFGPWIGYYNGSFALEQRELSLGTLLVDALLQHAIELGLHEVDMLAGFSAYKRRWSQGHAEQLSLATLPRTGWRNLPFSAWERAKSLRPQMIAS